MEQNPNNVRSGLFMGCGSGNTKEQTEKCENATSPAVRLSVVRWHWHATGGTGYHRINSIWVVVSRIRFRQCTQYYTMGSCYRLADNLGRGKMNHPKGFLPPPMVASQACAHAPPSWFKAAMMAKTASQPASSRRGEKKGVASPV